MKKLECPEGYVYNEEVAACVPIGEFQKRIKEEFEHQQKIYAVKSRPPMLPMGTLLNWIDEAKKEFPKRRLHITPQYVQDMEEWFEKWFGK